VNNVDAALEEDNNKPWVFRPEIICGVSSSLLARLHECGLLGCHDWECKADLRKWHLSQVLFHSCLAGMYVFGSFQLLEIESSPFLLPSTSKSSPNEYTCPGVTIYLSIVALSRTVAGSNMSLAYSFRLHTLRQGTSVDSRPELDSDSSHWG
jgi:hypothetical protein